MASHKIRFNHNTGKSIDFILRHELILHYVYKPFNSHTSLQIYIELLDAYKCLLWIYNWLRISLCIQTFFVYYGCIMTLLLSLYRNFSFSTPLITTLSSCDGLRVPVTSQAKLAEALSPGRTTHARQVER